MKAIKDIEAIGITEEKHNTVDEFGDDMEYKEYYWVVLHSHEYGFFNTGLCGKSFDTREEAIKNWEEFAELNCIKNYKIEE
ncbi:hypothetical protein ACFLS9_07810 [Bacteroidota bacterium]